MTKRSDHPQHIPREQKAVLSTGVEIHKLSSMVSIAMRVATKCSNLFPKDYNYYVAVRDNPVLTFYQPKVYRDK